jgi:iron(III) transport system substrate-binding protein
MKEFLIFDLRTMGISGQRDRNTKVSNWPKDEFGRIEIISQAGIIWSTLFVVALLLVSVLWASAKPGQVVVIYCAQDEDFAEPLLKDFENQSGIRVKAVYDNEAVKTVGLANRLFAERGHPQCDVFWANEEMRTRRLALQEVFRQTNGWAAFGYRSRRVAINTNKLSLAQAPGSLLELTNKAWFGKIALAFPQFGTTATHFQALRQLWGEEGWTRWCRALAANKAFIVDGNSVAVRMAGRGEAWIALTDSDDIAAGQREGMALAALPMNEETLLIPNTVAVTRHAPHPETAQRLFEYLQSSRVVTQLVAAQALEGISAGEVSKSTLQVNWNSLLRDVGQATAELNQIFLR